MCAQQNRELIEEIICEVDSKIRIPPSVMRQLKKTSNKIIEQMEQDMHEKGWAVRGTLQGSCAKDTALLENLDIDIFIEYDSETEIKSFEDMIQDIQKVIRKWRKIKKIESYEMRFTQHPYFIFSYNGMDVEVVPFHKTKGNGRIKTAVDRTPMHTEYINLNITDEMRKEIRVLKQFLKYIGAYGSDIAVQGFSGYLCELLVLHYKSFKEILISSLKWQQGTKIELLLKAKKRIMRKDRDFIDAESIIVVDPVDNGRNVAAALSLKQMRQFQASALLFLSNPNLKMFMKRSIKSVQKDLEGKLDKIDHYILLLIFPDFVQPSDKIWGQLKKLKRKLWKPLSENFYLRDIFVWVGRKDSGIVILLDMEYNRRVKKIVGPPVWSDMSKRFLEKYVERSELYYGPKILEERWHVWLKEKKISIRQYVDLILLGTPSNDIKGSKISVGKTLSKTLEKYVEIEEYDKKKLLQRIKSDDSFTLVLEEALVGRSNWVDCLIEKS